MIVSDAYFLVDDNIGQLQMVRSSPVYSAAGWLQKENIFGVCLERESPTRDSVWGEPGSNW